MASPLAAATVDCQINASLRKRRRHKLFFPARDALGLEIEAALLHEAAQMVSPISTSKNGRFCPALDVAISAKRCGAERITHLQCPLSCPHNPFNPSAAASFDAVLGKGLTQAARWIEDMVGPSEWARRFDAMDRRFHPERDIPLISYETQWALLSMSLRREGYHSIFEALESDEGRDLRNDTRIVIDKLARSRALMVEVTEASNSLPYYSCRDMWEPRNEYLYVDFGDQEPLEKGEIMFGRFLQHENCLYVVPGVFVGSGETKEEIASAVRSYLSEVEEDGISEALQERLPEIWNICSTIQDEFEGAVAGDLYEGEDDEQEGYEESCRAELELACDKTQAAMTLRSHPLFEEENGSEFSVDPLGESVFRVFVEPVVESFDEEGMDDEDEFGASDRLDEKRVRIGTVRLGLETASVFAMNPIELELLKALVQALVPCREQ